MKVVSEPRQGGRDRRNMACPEGEKQRMEERRHRCSLGWEGIRRVTSPWALLSNDLYQRSLEKTSGIYVCAEHRYVFVFAYLDK